MQKVNVLVYILIFIATTLKLTIMLDPDFGWHYQMGKYILSYGIPATDPFSYTMSNYPYVDHSWLANILMSLIYDFLGQVGLATVFSISFIITLFVLFYKMEQNSYLLLMIVICLLPLITLRPTIVSWMFFAIVFAVVKKEERWEKYANALPLLFLLWANTHAGFVMGLILIGCRLLIRIFEHKNIRQDIMIVFLSSLFTLINPYGLRLWQAIILVGQSSHFQVTEWQSTFLAQDVYFIFFIVFTIVLLFMYRNAVSLLYKTCVIIFLFFSISAVRHFPYFVIVSMPLIVDIVNLIKAQALRAGTYYKLHLISQAVIFFLIAAGIIRMSAELVASYRISENYYYPKKAIAYLQQNIPSGEVFTDYNWGGYVIWKLPQKKVFIDNRMLEWKKDDKKKVSIMEEYIGLTQGKIALADQIRKYGITTFVLPQKVNQLHTSDRQLIDTLTKEKFTNVYEDEVAIIYQKNL